MQEHPFSQTLSSYQEWKQKIAQNKQGFYQISEDRMFAFDEDKYSQQKPITGPKSAGYALVKLMNELGCRTQGPALEIGCGNGLVSVGLAEYSPFSDLIISDASPRFVEICKKNIESSIKTKSQISYAVFNGEEIDKLPNNTFSLITLANTLHHIEDYKGAVAKIKSKLAPKGAFIIQEPLGQGLLILGLIAQALFLEEGYHNQNFATRLWRKMLGTSSNALSVEESAGLSNFSQFVAQVSRRDTDKSNLEDKHLFSLQEFFDLASELEMDLKAYPNRYLTGFFGEPKNSNNRFTSFCEDYIHHCLGWGLPAQKKIAQLMKPLTNYIDLASTGRESPSTHGVFCFIKGA